jgi:hypothetical protein
MATCTAPGHSSCTITCSGGCIALYYEPNGPCKTACSNNSDAIEIDKARRFSVQITDIGGAELERLIGSSLQPTLRAAVGASRKSISLALTDVDFDTFVGEVAKVV